jgi:hypothetical protein
MPTKNAVAKAWSITPSYDGRRYSAWPAGDKPGGNPIIAYTDFVAGPTTGGENNKGCYLSVYGWNLGKFSDWGVNNHLLIGGVEVDNYRCLAKCIGSGIAGMGNGVFETFGLMRLTVQVGAIGSPTAGTALNISMTVGARSLGNPVTAGQYFDYLSGDALTFTPQPGPIIFVDPVNGNDANAGTFASPLQHLQSSTGHTTGAIQGGNSSSDTTGTKPGTHVYLRGGTFAPLSTTATGGYGMWANFFRVGGLAPSGATNRGPICITSYPGTAGANAPELAAFVAPTGASASGGFLGNDQARAQETNPFDGVTVGWAKYLHFSNLSITAAPDGPRDGAPFNLDSSADYWRIMNCEMVWKSTITDAINGASTHARAGGIAGNGYHLRFGGNFIHDIYGDTSFNENHGQYLDGSIKCAFDAWTGFTVIKNISAGNGLQTYNTQASDTLRNVFHHNCWVETVNKHGLNFSDSTDSRRDWSMVVLFAGEASVAFSGGSIAAANNMSVENSVLYGWGRVNSGRGALYNAGGTNAGSTSTRNCIITQAQGYGAAGGFTTLDGSGTNNLVGNRYWDPNGNLTSKPSGDTAGAFGDPLFNGASSKDFSLQSTSPCIDAAGTTLATRAFDFLGNVISGTADVGAFEYGAHL